MAESTIETAFVRQYGSQIYVLAQQMKSKFASKVRRETIMNARDRAFERIGEAEVQDVVSRHGDTPNNEIPNTRRWCRCTARDTNAYIDKEDDWRMLIDPQNKYAQAQAAALGRKMDDVIIEEAVGTAICGENRGTNVTFAEESYSINGDGTITSLGTAATAAGSGSVADIGLSKMLLMMQIFNQEDVDPDIPKYWAVNPKSIMDMLDITEVGSADYNVVRTLVAGKVDTFMGFNWFWSNRILKDSSTETAYRSLAWAHDGIILGLQKDIFSRISERADKRYTMQVYSEMSIGAVRMEGAKVHECMNKVA
jgi:hypothetical protein